MNRAMDLAQRLPMEALLVALGLAVLAPLLAGALVGGTPAVVTLLVSLLVLVGSGGLLALKAHINRLPLRLGARGVRARLDGHPSFHFRVQLGLGRRMDHARATVRFLPTTGDPIHLSPLLAEGRSLYGPWTLVVVDRAEQIRGPGRFEVRVVVAERGRAWELEASYPLDDLVEGRFAPALSPGALALPGAAPPPEDFDAVEAPLPPS